MPELLPRIIDSVKRMAQGGISTSESKFSIPYLAQVIHEAKSTVIRADFLVNKRIQAVWALPYYPDFDKDLQDEDCVIKFALPSPPVALDSRNDGLLYVGDKSGLCAYTKINSVAEMATYNSHRVTKVRDVAVGGKVKYLLVDGVIKIYGDKSIKEILINYIPQNPTLLPEYNIDMTPYPLDDANLSVLKTIVLQSTTGLEAKTLEDKVQDNSDAEGRDNNKKS